MAECIHCGDELDLDEPYLTVSTRHKYRTSWEIFARFHPSCFKEVHGDGEFDVEEWAE